MSLEWETQKAIYEKLKADAALIALGTGVYDQVPGGAANYPYVVLGEGDVSSWDTKTSNGQDHGLDLHVWTRKEGFETCKKILDAIYKALHKQRLTIPGGNAVLLLYQFSRSSVDPDGTTRHGVAQYRILTEDL